MDFLDPRKKRAHRRRLMFGYVLLSIAITLGTIILVYGTYGYSFNTKTGDVIENGLLFVDSHPGGASIHINGKDMQETTSARKVLQAGDYSLRLSKNGYRDWKRNFVLSEHSVARYVYPLLFPSKLNPVGLKKYSLQPSLITSSPDRHWLLVFSSEGGTELIDQFDTTNLKAPTKQLEIPANLLTSPGPTSTYRLVEWSTNNKQLIVERTFPGGTEFLMINRDKPSESFNINKKFGITPRIVALRDKKTDQIYIHTPDGQLSLGTTSTGQLAGPILKEVLDFKPYGSDLLLYVTKVSNNPALTQSKIWDDGKTYNLYKFPVADKYLIDVAKFQDDFYYIAGSSAGNYINLFKNPLDSLKDSKVGKALPIITLRQGGATKVAFSANARFVEAQAGQSFAVYDLEEQQYYKYVTVSQLVSPALWMDGHRLIGAASGSVVVMDYDKTNQQSLVSTVWKEGALFDREYETMFTISASTSGGFEVVSVDLRAGSDLPSSN